MRSATRIARECFCELADFAQHAPSAFRDPARSHARWCERIEACRKSAIKRGASAELADAVLRPIVACVDELALARDEPFRQVWMGQPLQLRFFGENLAGESFFSALAAELGDPRRTDVLLAYYICLQVGFRGKYAVGGDEKELARYIDELAHAVGKHASGFPISPAPPAAAAPPHVLRRMWPALVGAFVIAGSLAFVAGARCSIQQAIDEAGRDLDR